MRQHFSGGDIWQEWRGKYEMTMDGNEIGNEEELACKK